MTAPRAFEPEAVPFADLAAQFSAIEAPLRDALLAVAASGHYVLGDVVARFEGAAAAYLGVPHAVGVSSGTDALVVALLAAGVRPGDEVITSPLSFVATAESIARVGAVPRFIDVDESSLAFDVSAVERALGPKTRAVVAVHLYGFAQRVSELAALCQAAGVLLIEDAAQAFGTRSDGRAAGTWGAAGCFSFFPTKVLGALGDAGLVVTSDPDLAEACRTLRQHGRDRAGAYVRAGGNYRLDAVQAAVLDVKLGHLDDWVATRRAHVDAYDAAFARIPGVTRVGSGATEGWNAALYTLRVPGRRDALRHFLSARGIATAVYYATPLHLEASFRDLGVGAGSFPVTERAATEVVTLPLYAELGVPRRDTVIRAVRDFFAA